MKINSADGALQALTEMGTPSAIDCDVTAHKPSGRILLVIHYAFATSPQAGKSEILNFRVDGGANS